MQPNRSPETGRQRGIALEALLHAVVIAAVTLGAAHVVSLLARDPAHRNTYALVCQLLIPTTGFAISSLVREGSRLGYALLVAAYLAVGLTLWQLLFAATSIAGQHAQLALTQATQSALLALVLLVQAAVGYTVARGLQAVFSVVRGGPEE